MFHILHVINKTFKKVDDAVLETIIGGEYFDGLTMVAGLATLLAILISIYKIYASSKGKTKIGNDFTFEWE